MEFKVELDKEKMRAIERALSGHRKAMPKIVVRALKSTVKKGRTLIDREVRQRITIKKRAVMKRIIDLEKPTYSSWRAKLGISARRVGLISFGNVRFRKASRGGVAYTIIRGKTTVDPIAFMFPSAKGVFQRAWKEKWGKFSGKRVGRYPVMYLRGPSIGRVVQDAPAIVQQVEADGARTLSGEIDRQVNVELSKRMPR